VWLDLVVSVPAAVLTLMVPYYDLYPDAALPMAFNHVGWSVAGYIISVGAICSLTAWYVTIKNDNYQNN